MQRTWTGTTRPRILSIFTWAFFESTIWSGKTVLKWLCERLGKTVYAWWSGISPECLCIFSWWKKELLGDALAQVSICQWRKFVWKNLSKLEAVHIQLTLISWFAYALQRTAHHTSSSVMPTLFCTRPAVHAQLNPIHMLFVYTVIHFYFGADLILVIRYKHFLPKLNLYLNFSLALMDSAACSKSSGSLLRFRNFLRNETANFRFTKNCTLLK